MIGNFGGSGQVKPLDLTPTTSLEGQMLVSRLSAPTQKAFVRPGEKLWAKTEGLCAGDGTDDRAKIQALLTAAAAAIGGRGTVAFEPGDYGVNCTSAGLSIPWVSGNAPAVRIEGAGVGGAGGGHTVITRIRRTAGTNPLLSITGDPAGSEFANMEIENVLFHGGGFAGHVLYLSRVAQSHMNRVTVQNASRSGIYADTLWNCSFNRVMFSTLGDSGNAALTLTGTGGNPFQTHTVHFTGGCEWEGNNGIPIYILGQNSFGGTAMNFSDFKIERSMGNFPCIRIENSHNCSFSNGIMSQGHDPVVANDQPHFTQLGSEASFTSIANRIVNCEFTQGSPWSGAYHIDQASGRLLVSNCDFIARAGLTAYWRTQAAVPDDGAGVGPCRVTDRTIPFWTDSRTGPVLVHKGAVEEWTGTANPPTHAAPNGSRYIRTNGAAGSSMWVRASGGWVNVG